MQSFYPPRFEREMSCTEAEWLRWLPEAMGPNWRRRQQGAAAVRVDAGVLGLRWRVLAPRAIALISLPRLFVRFRFAGVDSVRRHAFMKRFDLYMQRGGG